MRGRQGGGVRGKSYSLGQALIGLRPLLPYVSECQGERPFPSSSLARSRDCATGRTRNAQLGPLPTRSEINWDLSFVVTYNRFMPNCQTARHQMAVGAAEKVPSSPSESALCMNDNSASCENCMGAFFHTGHVHGQAWSSVLGLGCCWRLKACVDAMQGTQADRQLGRYQGTRPPRGLVSAE